MTRTQFVQRLAWLEAQWTPRPPVEVDAVALLTQAGITPDPWQVQVLQTPTPGCCSTAAGSRGKVRSRRPWPWPQRSASRAA